jgi:tRNA(His) guanylyltransferase
LVWLAESERSDVFFSGKVQKMCSVLTSMTAAKFATVIPAEYRDRLPHFGARVLKLPSKEEAMNTFLWRAMDARKNAISMVAQSRFSAKTLYGKDQAAMLAMLAMLAEAGVDFESYPVCFRRGSFVRRRLTERSLTDNELAQIPEKHRPSGRVVRAEYAVLDVPPFHKVTNRVGVIFDGEEPATQ